MLRMLRRTIGNTCLSPHPSTLPPHLCPRCAVTDISEWLCWDSFLFYWPPLSKRHSAVIKDNTLVVMSNLPPYTLQNFGSQMFIACCCLYDFSACLSKRLWQNLSIIKQNLQAIHGLNLKRSNAFITVRHWVKTCLGTALNCEVGFKIRIRILLFIFE